MTEIELANLRLAAWALLEDWGQTVELAANDPLRKAGITTRTVPDNFAARCASADKLVAWAMRPL